MLSVLSPVQLPKVIGSERVVRVAVVLFVPKQSQTMSGRRRNYFIKIYS